MGGGSSATGAVGVGYVDAALFGGSDDDEDGDGTDDDEDDEHASTPTTRNGTVVLSIGMDAENGQ
ncbi:hypothetical protein HK104_005353, partial [Borealophlyctis nickersoniae]